MNAIAGRFYQWLVPRELFRFLFLAVFLIITVAGVAPLIFRSDSSLLLAATAFGLAVGWLTGRIRLPAWAAGLTDGALGAELLLLLTGRLDIPLMGSLSYAVSAAARFLGGDLRLTTDIASSLAEAGRGLLGAAAEAARLQAWLAATVRGNASFDPAASALVWGAGFFLIASFAGWALSVKAKPLAAVAPAIILVGVEFAAARGDWHYPFLVVAAALVMVVLLEQAGKEEEWDRRGVGYSTTVRGDLAFSAAPALAVLLLAAYLIPSISLDDIVRWFREQTQPAALGSASGTPAQGAYLATDNHTGSVMASDFPWNHPLGRGAILSNNIEMVIVTGEKMQTVPGNPQPVAPSHYWKSESFDYFDGRGWTTGLTVNKDLPAKGKLALDLPGGVLLHQAVAVNRAGLGPVYAAGELVTVYEPYWLAMRSNGDLMGGMIALPRYEADSMVIDPDESTLRAAGTNYPEWIRARYLQLPVQFPQRVSTLARDLTATALTPYDQALAIQNYLRREMHYAPTVDLPPSNRDAVDYFLFDSKTGFCDYYASAMVVLARAAGIPARYVMGFAPGIFDPGQGRFLVRQSDSHAWPELYFPGIGWVEFEPTSNTPVIQRSSVPAPNPGTPPWLKGTNPVFASVWNFLAGTVRATGVPALIALLIASLASLGWVLSAPVRLRLLAPPRMVRGMYRALVAHGRRLGIPFSVATTPAEFGNRLAGEVPARAEPVLRITRLYARSVYGKKGIAADERRAAIKNWGRLDRELWGEWLRETFRRKGKRKN
jgi:transglutaminase-like putative cysteine protease